MFAYQVCLLLKFSGKQVVVTLRKHLHNSVFKVCNLNMHLFLNKILCHFEALMKKSGRILNLNKLEPRLLIFDTKT